MKSARVTRTKPILLISVCVIFLVSSLQVFNVFQSLEALAYDWQSTSIRSDLPAPNEISVILVEDASL